MHRLLLSVLLGLMLFSSACENKEERMLPGTEAIAPVYKSDTRQMATSEQNEFVDKMQQQIDELSLKLADLKKKAVSESGKAREKLDRQISALEREQKNIEAKLADLKSAIGEKWKELKSGVTDAIESLKKSVKNAS